MFGRRRSVELKKETEDLVGLALSLPLLCNSE